MINRKEEPLYLYICDILKDLNDKEKSKFNSTIFTNYTKDLVLFQENESHKISNSLFNIFGNSINSSLYTVVILSKQRLIPEKNIYKDLLQLIRLRESSLITFKDINPTDNLIYTFDLETKKENSNVYETVNVINPIEIILPENFYFDIDTIKNETPWTYSIYEKYDKYNGIFTRRKYEINLKDIEKFIFHYKYNKIKKKDFFNILENVYTKNLINKLFSLNIDEIYKKYFVLFNREFINSFTDIRLYAKEELNKIINENKLHKELSIAKKDYEKFNIRIKKNIYRFDLYEILLLSNIYYLIHKKEK